MKPTLTVACVILKSAWQAVPLRSALAALLLAEIAALGAAEPAAAWPPPHLRALPADYLQRAHASLVEVASQGARLLASEPVSGDSIHWIRYGIASLVLGEHVAEINRFFESAKFVWPANPKFGFGLFSTDAMRLYALMNHRTGVVKGRLSQAAQENLEKQMWQVAKVNSKLAEGSRGALEQEASENHHLTSKVGDFLAAQFIRNIPAFAKAQYDDGSTPAQQYAARRDYFLAWFDERARRGLFSEAGSPSYQAYTLGALFNLRDFAEDPLLQKKAGMFLDLAYANMAEETLLTTRGGPKSRVKTGHEYSGFSDRGYDLIFNAPGREFAAYTDTTRSTSSYYPAPVIVNLAKDTSTRGSYAFAKRWPGPVKAVELDWRTLDPEKSVLRYGFATPSYILGSVALDATWLNDLSMGFRWQGVVFASDPLARIGFEVQPALEKDWHGFNPFFTVQDRNVFVTQKWAPVPPNPSSANPAHLRVYFSPTLDELQEDGGWIFVKDGEAFACVKVVTGGYTWTPAWKHADKLTNETKSFITLQSEHSPVILVVNQASDYRHDFNAFKSAVKAQPIQSTAGGLQFATITFHGPSKPGQIKGQPVNMAPALGHDSPFIRSDWNSGLIHIRKGDDNETLDFRDPKNPVKTLGAPMTPAFPPGVGTAPPIIFGNKASAMHFKPRDHALGDVHPFFHEGECFLYYLKPGKYESALACSKDWLTWTETPLTHEVVKADDWMSPYFVLGVFHDPAAKVFRSFYGHAQGRMASSVSGDLLRWSCAPKEFQVPAASYYERRRDPFVFWIPEMQQYGCVMTTQIKGRSKDKAGAISLATSADLKQWQDHGPILDPGNIGEPECPQMFRLGQRWYLLASIYDRAVGQPVYWVSDQPLGPWGKEPAGWLDGKDLCAAQIAFDGDTPVLFGWIPLTPARPGQQPWGGHLALPREVHSLADGTLGTRLPGKLIKAFEPLLWRTLPDFTITAEPHTIEGQWQHLAARLPASAGPLRLSLKTDAAKVQASLVRAGEWHLPL